MLPLKKSEHIVQIDGRWYRPGDVVLDVDGLAWQAQQCISASGEKTVAFAAVGQPRGHLTYCPPRPLEPLVPHSRFMREVNTVATLAQRLATHSKFAYPHFWLWHAMFDGTRLCGCWHSKEMRATKS